MASALPSYRAPYGQQVSPAWITMTGKSWSGHDIYTGPNTADFDACGLLIRSYGSTVGTYDPTSKACYVKKVDGSDGTFGMLNPGTGSYFRLSGDFPGHNIDGAQKAVADVAACESLCTATGGCEGYFFQNPTKICYPKKPEDVASAMISGIFKY